MDSIAHHIGDKKKRQKFSYSLVLSFINMIVIQAGHFREFPNRAYEFKIFIHRKLSSDVQHTEIFAADTKSTYFFIACLNRKTHLSKPLHKYLYHHFIGNVVGAKLRYDNSLL